MKTTIKEFLPGTSFNKDGITYFRLETGNIAVEKETNITHTFSKDTVVEIITISKGFKLFRVNGSSYYSIAPFPKGYKIVDPDLNYKILDPDLKLETAKEYVTYYDKYYVGEDKHISIYDFNVLDVLCTKTYPEGRYVKYSDNSGYIGLFYLSDTEISDIFRHTEYIDIILYSGYFFCKKKNGEFDVFCETRHYVGTTPSICEITKVTKSVFYSDTTIFSNTARTLWSNFQVEVDEGILSADVVRFDKLEIIKVLTQSGTTKLYSINCDYLCTCYNEVKIIRKAYFDEGRESCIIYDMIGEKIVAYYCVFMYQTNERSNKQFYTCVPFAENSGFKFDENYLPQVCNSAWTGLYALTRQGKDIYFFKDRFSRFECIQDEDNIYFIIIRNDDIVSPILEFKSRNIFKMKEYEVKEYRGGYGRDTIVFASGKILVYSRYPKDFEVLLLTKGSYCWVESYNGHTVYVVKDGDVSKFVDRNERRWFNKV